MAFEFTGPTHKIYSVPRFNSYRTPPKMCAIDATIETFLVNKHDKTFLMTEMPLEVQGRFTNVDVDAPMQFTVEKIESVEESTANYLRDEMRRRGYV